MGGAEPDRSPGAHSAPTGAKLGRGGKAVAGLCRLPGRLPVLAHPQSGGRGRGSPGEAGENLGYHLPSPPSASGAESGAVAGGAACTEPAPCGRRSAGAALTGGLEAASPAPPRSPGRPPQEAATFPTGPGPVSVLPPSGAWGTSPGALGTTAPRWTRQHGSASCSTGLPTRSPSGICEVAPEESYGQAWTPDNRKGAGSSTSWGALLPAPHFLCKAQHSFLPGLVPDSVSHVLGGGPWPGAACPQTPAWVPVAPSRLPPTLSPKDGSTALVP